MIRGECERDAERKAEGAALPSPQGQTLTPFPLFGLSATCYRLLVIFSSRSGSSRSHSNCAAWDEPKVVGGTRRQPHLCSQILRRSSDCAGSGEARGGNGGDDGGEASKRRAAASVWWQRRRNGARPEVARRRGWDDRHTGTRCESREASASAGVRGGLARSRVGRCLGWRLWHGLFGVV